MHRGVADGPPERARTGRAQVISLKTLLFEIIYVISDSRLRIKMDRLMHL
jgi:hypothetical protein